MHHAPDLAPTSPSRQCHGSGIQHILSYGTLCRGEQCNIRQALSFNSPTHFEPSSRELSSNLRLASNVRQALSFTSRLEQHPPGPRQSVQARRRRARPPPRRKPALAGARGPVWMGWTARQGLTLVHFSAQLERFVWDRGACRGCSGGVEELSEGCGGYLRCILRHKRLMLS
jgi:hypothetical protein